MDNMKAKGFCVVCFASLCCSVCFDVHITLIFKYALVLSVVSCWWFFVFVSSLVLKRVWWLWVAWKEKCSVVQIGVGPGASS